VPQPTAPPRTPARRSKFKRKKVQNSKREKLEKAVFKKMQLNANQGTTTDEVIKGGAKRVRQFCTQLPRCMFF